MHHLDISYLFIIFQQDKMKISFFKQLTLLGISFADKSAMCLGNHVGSCQLPMLIQRAEQYKISRLLLGQPWLLCKYFDFLLNLDSPSQKTKKFQLKSGASSIRFLGCQQHCHCCYANIWISYKITYVKNYRS